MKRRTYRWLSILLALTMVLGVAVLDAAPSIFSIAGYTLTNTTGGGDADPPISPIAAGTGSLTVSNTVTGDGADISKGFTFTLTLSDRTFRGVYDGMTFFNGVAQFTLKHGESKTIEHLPAGATYTVTEVEANQDGSEPI